MFDSGGLSVKARGGIVERQPIVEARKPNAISASAEVARVRAVDGTTRTLT
jgi:hypothetical protein